MVTHGTNKKIDALFIDVDSCLCGIEGVDQLARWAGVGSEIELLTKQAMDGLCSFDQVFDRRLLRIQPALADLIKLGKRYVEAVTPYAREVITLLTQEGIDIYLVSGGYIQALYPVATYLGIAEHRVFANRLYFDAYGNYVTYERTNPLCTQDGKTRVIEAVKRVHGYTNIALIGDSATDVAARKVVDMLIGFTCYEKRDVMTKVADVVISVRSFKPLLSILLDIERSEDDVISSF